MGVPGFGTIGEWTEGRLQSWLEQRLGQQPNIRQLVSRAVADAAVPAGTFHWFCGAGVPTGYLACDGASVLRADFPALFDAIGTTYGAVDGDHFNVPDVQERVVAGPGATGAVGDDDGLAVGSRWGVPHTHEVLGAATDGPHHSGLGAPPAFNGGGATRVTPWDFYYDGHTHVTPDVTSEGATADPPYIVFQGVIKV